MDKKNKVEDLIVTPHLLANTPFLEYCDGNRLQIAASQARQALPLENSEPAKVITSYERSIPLTTSRDFGRVKLLLPHLLVIEYMNGTYDIITIGPDEEVLVKENAIIGPDEVIKRKEYFFSNQNELTAGVNLLTAVMSHPLAFEDAFVVSESAAKKLVAYEYETETIDLHEHDVLLSIDDKNPDKYKPLPSPNTVIPAGKPYLRIGKDYITTKIKEFTDHIGSEIKIKQVLCIPTPVFSSKAREYELTVKFHFEELKERIENSQLPDEIKTQVKNLTYPDMSRKKKFDYHARLNISYSRRLELRLGDKLTNRHAAKGVVGLIVSDEEMPLLPDGRRVEIIINPMAIPSRMNLSQLYEIAATKALHLFKERLKQMVEEDKDINEIKDFILSFYKKMSTKANWIYEGVKQELDGIDDKQELLEIDWRFIAPGFESLTAEDLNDMLNSLTTQYALESTISDDSKNYIIEEVKEITDDVIETLQKTYPTLDINEEVKKQKVYKISPFVDVVFYNNKYHLITVGEMYFYRLVHITNHKLSARSAEYYDLSSFPTAPNNESGRTPQRFGEMEVWTAIAYDSVPLLEEVYRIKSDTIRNKTNYIIEKLQNDNEEIQFKPPFEFTDTHRLLRSYLLQLGIDMYSVTEDTSNIDFIKKSLKKEEEG